MNKVAVVTGANGFIGHALTQKLLSLKYVVYAVSRKGLTIDVMVNKKLKVLNLQMSNYDQIEIDIDKIDVVFLVAWDGIRGIEREDESLQMSCYRNNVNLIKKLIEIDGIHINKIITIGSQAEYAGNTSEEKESKQCLKNISAYGKWKTMLYNTLRDKYLCVNVVNARIYSAFGIGDSIKSLISNIMLNVKTKKELLLVNPDFLWSYTYLPDIIEGLIYLAENKKANGVYNVGSSEVKMLKEYYNEIIELVCDNNFVENKYQNTKNEIFNTDKINQLGWSHKYTFKQGIKHMLESEK